MRCGDGKAKGGERMKEGGVRQKRTSVINVGRQCLRVFDILGTVACDGSERIV